MAREDGGRAGRHAGASASLAIQSIEAIWTRASCRSVHTEPGRSQFRRHPSGVENPLPTSLPVSDPGSRRALNT
eukprot:15483670-Alexandrium_andersonii.AAC.1